MKISKYQFEEKTIELVTYDDFHQAVEDEISIYNFDGKQYLVVELAEVYEDGRNPYVVFHYNGKLQGVVLDEEIVKKILEMYEHDDN